MNDVIQQALGTLERILIKTFLPEEALSQYEQGAIGQKYLLPFAERIKKFSKTYTVDRKVSKDAAFSPEDAEAYTFYYTPINCHKVLTFLPYCGIGDGTQAIKVLDFGSGPGSGSLAAALQYPGPLDITLIESLACMRTIGTRLFSALQKERTHPLTFTFKSTYHQEEAGSYDLIIAANALNEIPDEKRLEVAEDLFSLLKPDGTLFILEPALSHITRKTMKLRDELLAEDPSRRILYPCPERAECPMLKESETDWCHAEFDWERPQIIHTLDSLTGFNKHRIKYAAYVIGTQITPFSGIRIVDIAKKRKHETDITVCCSEYYGTLTRPKRERSENNRQLEKVRLHDVVTVNPFPQDRQVTRDTLIERLDKFS